MAFTCTICGEESTRICVWCTKDTCGNHLCEKCERCSDCCECDVPLTEPVHESPAAREPALVYQASSGESLAPVSEPEPDHAPAPAQEPPQDEPTPAEDPIPAYEPVEADEPTPAEESAVLSDTAHPDPELPA